MHHNEQLISAWIDGELSPEEALRAAQLAANDAKLKTLCDKLIAIRKLRLSDTYDQKTPPLPEGLSQSLQSIIENAQVEKNKEEGPEYTEDTASCWNNTIAKAAVLVAAIGIGYVAGNYPLLNESDTLAIWSESVLSYQRLYTRETVTESTTSIKQVAALIASADLSTALSNVGASDVSAIAPLKAKKFKFTRAQILGYNNKKLLQLVYLADSGLPLAFCVMPLAGDESPPTLIKSALAGASGFYWQDSGFAYALVGGLPDDELEDLAKSMKNNTQSS